MSNNAQPNVNRQDHPHQEGQQNNTATTNDNGSNKSNNNQPMSNMRNESEEQRSGNAHGQKPEGDVQEGERTL